MSNDKFTPREIARDNVAISDTLKAWEIYTAALVYSLADCAIYLNKPDLTADEFLTFPIDQTPARFLAHLMKLKNQVPSDINIEKMIALGLADSDTATEILENLRHLQNARLEATRVIKFDIAKLIDEDGLFHITPELEQKIERHFTTFTATQTENNLLDDLTSFTEVLNRFTKYGLIRPQYGRSGLNGLINCISPAADRQGFAVSLNSFKSIRFKSVV